MCTPFFLKMDLKLSVLSFYEVAYNKTMYPVCFSGVFVIL